MILRKVLKALGSRNLIALYSTMKTIFRKLEIIFKQGWWRVKELTDKRAIWDWIKYNIRSHAIKFSKIKSQQNKEKETQLENDYSEAARKFEDDPSEDNKSRLYEVKEKLEQSYDEKIKGVIIRARARWHEYGEKSSKYFLNLEKRNQVKKHVRKLQINSSLTTNPSVILSEAKHFYMNLYKSTSVTADREILIEHFLNNLDIPKLSEKEKQSGEGKYRRKSAK